MSNIGFDNYLGSSDILAIRSGDCPYLVQEEKSHITIMWQPTSGMKYLLIGSLHPNAILSMMITSQTHSNICDVAITPFSSFII